MLRKAKEQFPRGHRRMVANSYSGVMVTVVSFGYDNYSYIVRKDERSNECLIVDCGDSEPVIDVLKEFHWNPLAVLTTHRHWDHCYGNSTLKSAYPNCQFIGGKIDRPNNCTRLVGDKEEFELAGLFTRAHEVFGHTLGHVVYEIQEQSNSTDPSLIFTGDTIFVAGIGKTFEGTNEQMIASLDLFESRFSPETFLFPGHEYARDGLGMARYLAPCDDVVQIALHRVETQYLQRIPSVPTRLRDELGCNPFLRTSILTNGGSLGMRAEKLVELRRIKEAYMENRRAYDEEAIKKRKTKMTSTSIPNVDLSFEKSESNLGTQGTFIQLQKTFETVSVHY